MNFRLSNSKVLLKGAKILTAMGLSDFGPSDWARMRGLRYGTLFKAARKRFIAQSVGSLAMAMVLLPAVRLGPLLIWLGLVGLTQWNTLRIDRGLAYKHKRRPTVNDILTQLGSSLAITMVWTLPLPALAWSGDHETLTKAWGVLSMMMALSVLLMPAVPIRSMIYSSVIGLVATISFLACRSFDMALIAVLYSAVVINGAVKSARRFLASRLAEAKSVEKDQVVSMLLREFEDHLADWLWQVDITHRVRTVSPRFAHALGREASDIEGHPLVELITGPEWEKGEYAESVHQLIAKMKSREHFANLLVRVVIDGEPRWWELSGSPRYDANGLFCGYRGVGSDVTEARESSEKIAWLARYDTLTGLPNRRMVTESLSTALEYAKKWRITCAFLMIDLDRFKSVNDTLGHHIGDQLLASVSQRLKEQLSDNESCGRLGGDEFAIVVRDSFNAAYIADLAQRVITRLSEPYQIGPHTLFVGASIGSAIGPRDGTDCETLIRNADLALYRSKDCGGNGHCAYEPSLHAHAEERMKLESSLRQALDNDEFTIIYQPVVNAQSEQLVGFEALLRWNNADHGAITPSKFVPIAEDTRLIVPIGEWILHEACREALKWPDEVRVAVNVSGEQLLDSNFVNSVVSALNYSGLPARRLEIEVTESIFLRDAAMARAALEEVLALGCAVALDDFGTGYSSLGYLRTLHFTTIKIDRSFVQGAATGNPESIAIIRAVVAMADSLGMSTTAEGAETEDQVEVIRTLGCRNIQGYHFGLPMTGKDALALVHRAYPETAPIDQEAMLDQRIVA